MCKDLQQSNEGLKIKDKSKNKNKNNPSSRSYLSNFGQIAEVIEYLNEKTGRHFRLYGANASTVGAALTGKGHIGHQYSVDDLKLIIDWKMFDWDIADNPLRKWNTGKPAIYYMRPITLFSWENIAKYLEEAELWRNDFVTKTKPTIPRRGGRFQEWLDQEGA